MNRVNQIYNDDLAIKMVFVDTCPGSVPGPASCMDRLNLNNAARETAAVSVPPATGFPSGAASPQADDCG